MKIYLVKRTDYTGYDEYDSTVVIAKDEESAKRIHPNEDYSYDEAGAKFIHLSNSGHVWTNDSWTNNLSLISVTYIGEAHVNAPAGVILSSYNAG